MASKGSSASLKDWASCVRKIDHEGGVGPIALDVCKQRLYGAETIDIDDAVSSALPAQRAGRKPLSENIVAKATLKSGGRMLL